MRPRDDPATRTDTARPARQPTPQVKHNENVRARASPRPGARGLVAVAPTEAELKVAEAERQAWAESLEQRKEADMARRESGQLRADMKEDNTDVYKVHFGYGQIDDEGHKTWPWNKPGEPREGSAAGHKPPHD